MRKFKPGGNTKIFLDGGDPQETREIIDLLGFLDGQTTNPTLIAKNPDAQARLKRGERFSEREIYEFYRNVVRDLSQIMVSSPSGGESISIEVYADRNTTADQILKQGREFFAWIPNAHIKFPTTVEGLKAAEQAVREGMRINMTLCFSQQQAAAVYAATRGATRGQVFVSPFVGRLDDQDENGMQLIENILRMYRAGDGHAEVLTASVRSIEHFMYALALESDIITAPAKVLREWSEKGMPITESGGFTYNSGGLKPIPYVELDLRRPWTEFNIIHELTDAGIEKFAADWNSLISIPAKS